MKHYKVDITYVGDPLGESYSRIKNPVTIGENVYAVSVNPNPSKRDRHEIMQLSLDTLEHIMNEWKNQKIRVIPKEIKLEIKTEPKKKRIK